MNINSLRRIEEVIIPSGRWSGLEISQDTIYIDFTNVELGNPKIDKELLLSIRFAKNTFIMFFYNNIWDLEFLSNFDHKNVRIDESFNFKVKNIRFLDFEYLDKVSLKFSKNKLISQINDFNINNIRNDFFLSFEIGEVAIIIGADQMDFFNKSEKIDDFTLKDLSNQWMLYFLDYISEKKLINKDPMCEAHIKGD